jgi:extradiol dioxygenase family protein
MPRSAQGKRHFGVVLPWDEWEALADSLQGRGVPFLGAPSVELAGTPNEQAKFYLEDPSHNLIEVKAYRDVAATLGVSDAGYRRAGATP